MYVDHELRRAHVLKEKNTIHHSPELLKIDENRRPFRR